MSCGHRSKALLHLPLIAFRTIKIIMKLKININTHTYACAYMSYVILVLSLSFTHINWSELNIYICEWLFISLKFVYQLSCDSMHHQKPSPPTIEQKIMLNQCKWLNNWTLNKLARRFDFVTICWQIITRKCSHCIDFFHFLCSILIVNRYYILRKYIFMYTQVLYQEHIDASITIIDMSLLRETFIATKLKIQLGIYS